MLRIPSDSVGAARRDSLRRTEGDTAAAFLDTLRSLPRHGWERARLGLPEPVGPRVVLPESVIVSTAEGTLREMLVHRSVLRTVPSGTYNLPDPTGIGDLPGREPPAETLDGIPLTIPGFPALLPDAVGLSWVDEAVLTEADPLALPSNPSGGPLLEMTLVAPDSGVARSGVRLTQATNSTHTEEAFLARPTRVGLLRIFYEDRKTQGREIYLDNSGQNLRARFDHGGSWGGWRMEWWDSRLRANLLSGTRFLWDRSGVRGGASWRGGGWAADLGAGGDWNRLRWVGADGSSTRKDGMYQSLLRVRGPGGVVHPLLTVQADLHQQRYTGPGIRPVDRRRLGLGFAGGLEGTTSGWRWRGSLGRSAPAPGRSGWAAAFSAERALASGWTARLHADRMVRPLLVPRFADELGTYVAEGLVVPTDDPDRPLEEIRHLEATLTRGARGADRLEALEWADRGGAAWRLRARAVEFRHTISAAGGNLRYLQPGGFAQLLAIRPGAADATVRVASLSAWGDVPLRYGFRAAVDATVREANPSWQDELWMTPWEAMVAFSWRGRLFKGDLDLELYLRGTLTGPRATSQVTSTAGGELRQINLPFSDRYDAGVIGRIVTVVLFAEMRNLEDDLREAAAYEGGFALLPLRSYRIGLTWYFED